MDAENLFPLRLRVGAEQPLAPEEVLLLLPAVWREPHLFPTRRAWTPPLPR